MFEVIRDAAKIGLGAVSLSKDNIKKLTDNLVEIGKVSREEGDRLFTDLEKSATEFKESMKETIEENVRKIVEQSKLATRTELEDLRKKIEELEEKLKD